MSMETVTTGMKAIVEDGINVESELRDYLYERAKDGTIYDFWLVIKHGALAYAMIKEHNSADFLPITLREKTAA